MYEPEDVRGEFAGEVAAVCASIILTEKPFECDLSCRLCFGLRTANRSRVAALYLPAESWSSKHFRIGAAGPNQCMQTDATPAR